MSTNKEEIESKLVEHLVNRFLGWHLPKDFHPDCGIMFMDVYDNGTEQGGKFEPTGTNLFTAAQAKEMFRFLLEHEDGTSALTSLTKAHKVEMEKMVEEERVRLLFLAQSVLKELNNSYSIDIKYADKKQWVEPEEFERIFLHRFNNAGLEEV